jgi:predicted metalloendopeptidase
VSLKLDNGEWYRQSTGTDDQAEAEDIAFKLCYGADKRDKNNLPKNTSKFGNVARFAEARMTEELGKAC